MEIIAGMQMEEISYKLSGSAKSNLQKKCIEIRHISLFTVRKK